MKKQIGIWLDFKEAIIIELTDPDVTVSKVESTIEAFHPKGGARSKSPWGPMDKISESKYLERRKHQEKDYFHKIILSINNADEIYIFGPAEAKDKFLKTIRNSHGFGPLVKGVERTDSITDNQKIAKVKAFFNK